MPNKRSKTQSGATMEKISGILANPPFSLQNTALVSGNLELKSLRGWDSLKHLMFLMEVEKQFEIEILPEEIRSITTIEDLIKKIYDHKRA